MKHKLTFIFTILLSGAIVLTVFAQGKNENKDKGKGNNKEQQQGKGKGNNKEDRGNDNNNRNDNSGKGNDNDKGNKNKDKNDNEPGNGKGKDNDDDNGKGNGRNKMKDGYKWDNETFVDRNNIRKGMNKVTLCHKFNRGDDPAVTIRVSENALKAHMNHGDIMGECPSIDNSRFSTVFLDRRTDYYQVLQNGQEQVLYSRSILDYAIERLTGARTQLVTLQSTNAPAADIERKRLLVVDLENNVSLLQTLVGVTANLIADKLVN